VTQGAGPLCQWKKGGRKGAGARLLRSGPEAGPRREERRRGGGKRPRGERERMGRARDREGEEKLFSFYFSSFYSNPFKRIFKPNLNLKKLHSIKYMQQHGCTYMCRGFIVNFNSIKKLISYYFPVLTTIN